jgi:hypothetical protein
VTRAAPALDEDPTQEPNVRTHRMLYPNRRPLLISAILVALTSIPTIIVVAAGTVTLHDREPARPPAIADSSRGPVVVQPHSSAGLRDEPPLASESGHGRPADHTSAQAAGSGGGGAFSLGTGASQPNAGPPPATGGTTGTGTGTSTGSGSGSASTSGSSSGSSSGSGPSSPGSSSGSPGSPANPEDCPTPTSAPSPAPAPHPTQGSGGRIDDDAWPGWDSNFHG